MSCCMKPGVMWLVATNRHATVHSRPQGIWEPLFTYKPSILLHTSHQSKNQTLSRHEKRLTKTSSRTGFHTQGHWPETTRAFLFINKAVNNRRVLLSFTLCFLLFFHTSLDQNIFFFCRFLATANYNTELFWWSPSRNQKKLFYGLTVKIMRKEHADTERCVLLQTQHKHTGWCSHYIQLWHVWKVWSGVFSVLRV